VNAAAIRAEALQGFDCAGCRERTGFLGGGVDRSIDAGTSRSIIRLPGVDDCAAARS
jgi:hypothetical protein